MRALLTQMYKNLSDSLSKDADLESRQKNHQKQLDFYDKLFSLEAQNEDREKMLVCARCIISISRSIAQDIHSAPSIEKTKKELMCLEDIFVQNKGRLGRQIRSTVQERINKLSQNSPDEMSDSILFLYLSLMQL